MTIVAFRRAAIAAVALGAASCAPVPPSPALPASSIEAYVLVGPGGGAVARAVVTATSCPSLDVDGVAQPMTLRAPAMLLPKRPKQAKASDFPVTVCDAPLPATARRVTVAGRALPLPKAESRRIVLIGDTGCRVFAPYAQACNDPERWPFARVAAAAAATAPDLVIHVGDYHYRETPCPVTEPGCAGSPWGYGFDAWHADFLGPARPLLAAAPWIVVRGNHETCDRAGQGWWRLVDPRPLIAAQDCNDAANDAIGDYSAPYVVPLGGDARVIVFDSSNAGNAPIPQDGLAYRTYRAQLAAALADAGAPGATLFAVHHPPLAFAANPGRPQSPYPGNAALQATLRPQFGDVLFPPSIGAVLSGHNHAFETVAFAPGPPPQIVVGNGGTAADEALPEPFPAGLAPAPGTVVRALGTTNRYGFATLERTATGWTLTGFDSAGTPFTTCALTGRTLECTPIAR